MIRTFCRFSWGFLVLLGVAGCVWVDLTPGGQGVRVLDVQSAKGCKKLGTITAETTPDVAGIPRDGESLNNELTRIARNHAAGLGGNAILALGPSQNGSQRFTAYRCPQGSAR